VQSVLEDEVTELLGPGRSERWIAVDGEPGYRNGYGKPRRLTLSCGTTELRRSWMRDVQERFESHVLPLFARRSVQVNQLIPEMQPHVLAHRASEALLPSVSVVLFGTLGPFERAFSSLNLLGYGLGGTATHLAAMVPATGQAVITAASWARMPTLTTSLGRVFAETGIVGLLLFAGMWLVAFRAIGRLRRATTDDRAATVMLGAASLALVGLAIGHAMKFGSFALPYLWFWLAYVDSRFLISATEVEKA
jgi:hypothetical protein